MQPRNPTDNLMSAELQTIFTIGVYGSTEESFFGALVENEIELFIDVRARRGMRGARYSYANSKHLQMRLGGLGIAYAHLPELAPTKEIRAAQNEADKGARIKKRQRTELSREFIRAYKRDVLRVYRRKPEFKFYAEDMLALAAELAGLPCDSQPTRAALFCVERAPTACHRSLLADELSKQLELKIVHIQS